MDVVYLSDLMVVRAIYGRTFENSWCQFRGVQANVIGVVHVVSSVRFVCGERTTNSLVCSWTFAMVDYKKTVESNQIMPQLIQPTVSGHGFRHRRHCVVSFTKKIEHCGG
jgi:hypothetical protein